MPGSGTLGHWDTGTAEPRGRCQNVIFNKCLLVMMITTSTESNTPEMRDERERERCLYDIDHKNPSPSIIGLFHHIHILDSSLTFTKSNVSL